MTTISSGGSVIDGLNAGAKPSNSNTLDQNAFLKLMTTQLKTQDPFEPVDNSQMVAQMAQFSSVAGISEINASLKTMADDLAASRIGDAASWIGRAALIESDVAAPLSNGSYAGEIALPKDASAVTLSLVDENGSVHHTQSFGAQAAGPLAFHWDGKGTDGQPVGKPLRLIVTASAAEGGTMEVGTSTWAGIAGVQSPASGSTKLVTGLGLINPAEALRLS
ncbi:flagellar hook capping protein [Sphingomonas oleivorans]|uniref:Basal-body rod modification protein FlgD n=1 Tax=Sphingomonas oleivorans TaxID=1735121 RepID=A0A2T5FUF1_9SPHN|nr:flagellar hook capping FlgD N-terminal domain-containing protein [Sphingomonas oleivorans]PTQ08146.1 flagellar hook capping protein [Sphingomonas oleivorans]